VENTASGGKPPASDSTTAAKFNRKWLWLLPVLAVATYVAFGLGVGWGSTNAVFGDHHWATIATSVSALVAATGVLVGGTYATLYGRRASVRLSAEAYEIPGAFLVAARVRVRAVGVLRVKFHETEGATVRLSEARIGDDGSLCVEGEDSGRSWAETKAFDQQYVDPGEELSTTITFGALYPEESVVGWMAFVYIYAPTRFTRVRTAYWADRIFVARPPTRGYLYDRREAG